MAYLGWLLTLALLPLLIVLAAVDLDKLGLPTTLGGSVSASVWRIVALVALFGWTDLVFMLISTRAGLQHDFRSFARRPKC